MEHDDIRRAREILYLLKNLLHRCVMFDAIKGASTELNFFRVYQSCLMDMICIDWCKVFGTDGEESHWKNVIPSDDHDSFRDVLEEALSESSCVNLQAVWQKTKCYRDTASAHLDLDETKRSTNYPVITPLRVTAEVLYRKLFSDLKLEQRGGIAKPSEIMDVKRSEIVSHNAKLFDECLNSLSVWTNARQP